MMTPAISHTPSLQWKFLSYNYQVRTVKQSSCDTSHWNKHSIDYRLSIPSLGPAAHRICDDTKNIELMMSTPIFSSPLQPTHNEENIKSSNEAACMRHDAKRISNVEKDLRSFTQNGFHFNNVWCATRSLHWLMSVCRQPTWWGLLNEFSLF